jgi:hypothetical protein
MQDAKIAPSMPIDRAMAPRTVMQTIANRAVSCFVINLTSYLSTPLAAVIVMPLVRATYFIEIRWS